MEGLGLDKKPILSYLKLNVKRCGAVTEALRFTGHCTGALRAFKIQCQVQEMGAFAPVAEANPFLEDVHISLSMERVGGRTRFAFGELVEEDQMDDLLNSLGVFLSLRQFKVLHDSGANPTHTKGSKTANTCCSWRLLRVLVPYIHKLSFDYLK